MKHTDEGEDGFCMQRQLELFSSHLTMKNTTRQTAAAPGFSQPSGTPIFPHCTDALILGLISPLSVHNVVAAQEFAESVAWQLFIHPEKQPMVFLQAVPKQTCTESIHPAIYASIYPSIYHKKNASKWIY